MSASREFPRNGIWHRWPRTAGPGYLVASAGCATTTLLARLVGTYLDLVNTVMLFLLTVLLVAVRYGRGPAVWASFASVALFDFFFVPPRLSLAVSDAQYLLTFGVMLAVALSTSHLTASLKQQAGLARSRQLRANALYELAREIAGALTIAQVREISQKFIETVAGGGSTLLLADATGRVVPSEETGDADWLDQRMAQQAYETGTCTDIDARVPVGYFPLRAPTRARGVLAARFDCQTTSALLDHRELLEAVASLAAIAVERVHYVEVANAAQLEVESERLRSSILSAISHDIRTPLTVLVGLADSLAVAIPARVSRQQETAEAIRDQSIRLSNLVSNLLDMARLQGGRVKLRKEWQPIEEVVGSSLKLLERSLTGHSITTDLPQDLPLLCFDAVLIERVMCNLIDNASKYAPCGTTIALSVETLDRVARVIISDEGPGLDEDQRTVIFDMFVRAHRESTVPGLGMGLAICRVIVEAHGGDIWAENCTPRGARFIFTLPLGTPPSIDEEAM